MGSTKTMRFGILILLLGLGMISTLIPQVAGTPVSFLFGGLSSTTLRIINAIGYALILLGLILGLLGRHAHERKRWAIPPGLPLLRQQVRPVGTALSTSADGSIPEERKLPCEQRF